MSLRMIAWILPAFVIGLAAQPAWADSPPPNAGNGLGRKGQVGTSNSGNEAGVEASLGYDGVPDADQMPWLGADTTASKAGKDPWAHYQLVPGPGPDEWQLCRDFNPGHVDTGTDDRTELCFPVYITEEDTPDVDPTPFAARAVAKLTIPEPGVMVDPQPSDNKWNALAVGLPLWFYTDKPAPIHTSVTEDGIQITMTAHRKSIQLDFGDGNTTSCTTGTPRPAGYHPLTPSSTCGHAYMQKGDYTLTATANWEVTWQALGKTGTIPLSTTQTMQLPVSEFAAVVVG